MIIEIIIITIIMDRITKIINIANLIIMIIIANIKMANKHNKIITKIHLKVSIRNMDKINLKMIKDMETTIIIIINKIIKIEIIIIIILINIIKIKVKIRIIIGGIIIKI